MSSCFFQRQYARLLVSIWHNSFLSPYANCLVCSMLNMLNESCLWCGGGGGGGWVIWPVFGGTGNIMHNQMTTNFSRILWSSSPSTGGFWLSFLKTVDASGHAFHVCYALFSPLPWNADTTSQPVNAWINGRHIDFSRSIKGLISFMRIHFFVLDQMRSTVFLHQCKVLQNWQNTDRNDKNICVAGFIHYSVVTVCCSVFWMQEDSCVCSLMIAVS